MRWLILISMLLISAGTSLLIYTAKMPVYTDKTAPDRIGNELYPEGNLSRDEMNARFDEWFSRLRAYETPYKKLSDLGRGLCAAGVGLLLAGGIWVSYYRFPWMRTMRILVLLWVLLWVVRIPLSIWYYTLRAARHDYPGWGDSIAIGIFEDWITWIIGAIVSSSVLFHLLKRYKLPSRITLIRPRSVYEWLRMIFFVCWIAVLAESVVFGIPNGDEGAVFTSIVAITILLVFLSADEVKQSDKSPATPLDHPVVVP